MTDRFALLALVLSIGGCSPASSEQGPVESPAPVASSLGSAPAGSASATAAAPVLTGSASSGPSGALFTYEEDGLTVAFASPNHVSRVGGDKPCAYDLSDRGNMYSGKELEAAWRDAEVQAALAKSSAFLSPSDLQIPAEVRDAQGRIAWTPACGGLCIEAPKGVTTLLHMLHVLAVNARGVCKI